MDLTKNCGRILVAQVLIKIDGRELAAHRVQLELRKMQTRLGDLIERNPIAKGLVRVQAILEDPDYSPEKYSPTHFYLDFVRKRAAAEK